MKKNRLLLSLIISLIVLVATCPFGTIADEADTDIKYGGTLKVVTTDSDGSGPIGQPWIMASSITASRVAVPCFDTLVTMDAESNLYPCLAESWEFSEDKSSLTLNLRKDVSFTDGTPFNAEAVIWNIQKWKENGMVDMCYAWTNIEAVDEYTVKIDLMFYQNNALSGFAEPYLGFISPSAYEENGGDEWASSNIVSTGPFILDKLEVGVGWSYTKNENYWGEGPYLDAIEFQFISDDNTAKLMLMSGDCDIVQWTSFGEADIKAELMGAGFDLIDYEVGNEPAALFFDSANEESPFANKLVRQAVDYAIDKEAIASMGMGTWYATDQIIGQDSKYYNPELVRGYDPDKAKELLAEAGYPDGFSTQLIVENTSDENTFVAITQYLKAVGIEAELKIVPPSDKFGFVLGGFDGMLDLLVPNGPNYMATVYKFLGKNGLVVSLDKPDEMETIINKGQFCELGEEQGEYIKELAEYCYENCTVLPTITSSGVIGARAAYVHDDGWGGLTTGYWSPGKCWLDR